MFSDKPRKLFNLKKKRVSGLMHHPMPMWQWKQHATSLLSHKIFIRFIWTLYIIDYKQTCLSKPHYSKQEENPTNWCGVERIHSAFPGTFTLTVNLAKHYVLCTWKRRRGSVNFIQKLIFRIFTRFTEEIFFFLKLDSWKIIAFLPIMATTSASMCPLAILSRPA